MKRAKVKQTEFLEGPERGEVFVQSLDQRGKDRQGSENGIGQEVDG